MNVYRYCLSLYYTLPAIIFCSRNRQRAMRDPGGEHAVRTPGQGAMRKHCKARLGFCEAALSRQDVWFVVVETIVLNECV